VFEIGYQGARNRELEVSRQLSALPNGYLSASPARDNTTINYLVANLPNRPTFGIFEVGAVFAAGQPVPKQSTIAAAAFVGDDGATLFRRAKGVLELLGRRHHGLRVLSCIAELAYNIIRCLDR